MPMGIVSDSELLKELDNSSTDLIIKKDIGNSSIEKSTESNKIEGTIVDIPSPGRKEGDVNVPDGLRKIIGETSAIEGRTEAVALGKQFGISPSSVSAYSNGSTSTDTYNKSDRSLVNHIDQAKERISRQARHRLSLALRHITEEKLQESKPEILANVARNMAAIVKDMEPKREESTVVNNGPQFVFYAPQQKSETAFETMVVNE